VFGSILVGTDGSETAHSAVAQAVDLAKSLGARLEIVCAYEPVAGSRLREERGVAPADMPALVRPQLWAMAEFEALGADLVAREVADDLAVVLSLDLPAAVQVVPPDDVARTGLTEDDLWERALARLDDGEPIERTLLDGNERVEVLISDSHFLASRLLALEELVGRLPAHGALVAVPHRHMLLVHAIRDESVLDAAHLMAPFTVERFEEGPGSLSPHLYWWHGGDLERLVVDDDEGSITPPDGFVALLESLTRE